MASRENVNYSIHPRAWHLVDKTFTKGQKSNTSKARSSRNMSAHKAHVESNPKDAASRAHLAKREAL